MLTNPSRGNLIVYADGSISTQRAGVGIAVCSAEGHILHVGNQSLPHMTSNEAEYAALYFALQEAQRWQPLQLEIRMDNEVVVNQMAGHFAVNSPRLKRMHQHACKLARQFAQIRYCQIPRDLNAIADALASEASAGRKWKMVR
ncbi:ribonuclease HI family protein [Phototrophicus methaneseepsis]|uniref:Ribonuclease HI family protein n=1 Tax=Phototrophicus methaneseepsis TaxID=2710758 RepID=A0A7S8E5U2_9CHLR|nr:ribonuclease HI family protein [Phototrophicus methaneseepsis]QPC80921.1 ribonuclease HI family protein [Phototrophicus methaneseepsis]